MAVAFVRAGNGPTRSGSFTSDSVTTFSATGCSLVVAFVTVAGTVVSMTGITATYGGVTMTPVAGTPFGPASGISTYIMAFYLANPPTGTNTFSVSWTGTQQRVQSGLIGFSGAGAISSIRSETTSVTVSVTSTANSMVAAGAGNQNATAPTITTVGGTTDYSQTDGVGFAAGGGHIPGASTVVVDWDDKTIQVAFSVDPASSFYFPIPDFGAMIARSRRRRLVPAG